MERLTKEHHKILESNWGAIKMIATKFSSRYRYGDDDFLGFTAEYVSRKAPKFDPLKGDDRSWVIQQARFACIEYLDSLNRKRIPVKKMAESGMAELIGPTKEPWVEIAAREECDRLLGLLNPRERDLVESHVFDDMKMEDMGKSLGITQSGASKIKMRAFAKMRAAC